MKTITVTTPTKGFEGWLVTNPLDRTLISFLGTNSFPVGDLGYLELWRPLGRSLHRSHLLVGGI